MNIAIFGTGNIGSTLGRGWAARGHSIVFGARNPQAEDVRTLVAALGPPARAASHAEAAREAEAIALAVPFAAVGDVLGAAGDLAGKVLIDCTNPIGPNLTAAVPSGADVVARHASGARVVKAFNTAGFGVYADARFAEKTADLYLCGDDSGAKEVVARLARELGLEPVDCGPLAKAELLEALARLWISLAFGGAGREIAFKLLRR